MLKHRIIALSALIALSAFLAACSGDEPVANTSKTPANTMADAANSGTESTSPETAISEDTTGTGSLATPSDAYKTFWDLRSKKDIEGIKKILSKDILEFFTEVGEADGKSVEDMIRELAERPQASKPEVRNEKISGERATLEFLDHDGKWKDMDFEKEGGVWKLTIPKMDAKDLEIETKP